MKKYFNFLIFLFLALLSTRIFSFTLIEKVYFDYVEIIISVILVLVFLFKAKNILRLKWVFPEVKWILITTVFSFLPALLFHDQEISLGLLASRTTYFWLGYYLLKVNNVKLRDLHNVMLVMGFVWSLIMIIQQITYPVIYFNFLNGSEFEINRYEERGNLLRIFIDGSLFGFYFLFFYWGKFIKKLTLRTIFMIVLGLSAVLFTGSRQIIFSIFVVFLFSFFSKIKSITRYNTSFIYVFVNLIFIVITFAGDYLLSLVTLSLDQNVTSDNYIRILEMKFFVFEYWPNFLAVFIGNGWEHALSSYGVEIGNFKYMNGFYRSDIGLLGAFNKFGIVYLLVILSLFYRIIKKGSKLFVPDFIQYFFLLVLLTSISGANYFEIPSCIFILISILYILDKTNEKNSNCNTHI
ncbi:hypothetical protein [Flavobacterium sp. WC2416]|uniref:O-antigen ligase domain-containing protein n=1 Tax=Flavobacterium sp. WC2416 TaxID=3234141 RepID=A0AB39WAQ0_9FLAO